MTWASHLKDPKARKDFEDSVHTSVHLKRLRDIVNKKMDAIVEPAVDYDNASWSHKQAHINGQKDILVWLQKLLDIGR